MKWIATNHKGHLNLGSRYNQESFRQFLKEHDGCTLEIVPRDKTLRTETQADSLHLWLRWLAQELNRNGLTKQLIMSTMAEIDWTEESVKEDIWKRMQKAVLKTDSTKKLKKQEDIDLVMDHLNRWFSKNPEVNKTEFEMPPFPHYEDKDKAIRKI